MVWKKLTRDGRNIKKGGGENEQNSMRLSNKESISGWINTLVQFNNDGKKHIYTNIQGLILNSH